MCSPPTKRRGYRDAPGEPETRSLVCRQWAEACVGLFGAASPGEAGHSHGGKSCLCGSRHETGPLWRVQREVSSQLSEAPFEHKVDLGLSWGLGHFAPL